MSAKLHWYAVDAEVARRLESACEVNGLLSPLFVHQLILLFTLTEISRSQRASLAVIE